MEKLLSLYIGNIYVLGQYLVVSVASKPLLFAPHLPIKNPEDSEVMSKPGISAGQCPRRRIFDGFQTSEWGCLCVSKGWVGILPGVV